MAARNTPSRGGKPDKLMRDALMLELAEEMKLVVDGKTVTFRKMRLVARGLVNAAIKGDVPAGREIFDRVDGKVVQKIGGEGKNGAIQIENLNVEELSDEQLDALTIAIANRIAGSGGSKG